MVMFIGPRKAQLVADILAAVAFGLVQDWGPFSYFTVFMIPEIILETVYLFIPYLDVNSTEQVINIYVNYVFDG